MSLDHRMFLSVDGECMRCEPMKMHGFFQTVETFFLTLSTTIC